MFRQIISDFHLHSDFSGDSDTPMEDMIRAGIAQNLQIMCMTEHLDVDYPAREGDPTFDLDINHYHQKYLTLQEQYRDQLQLLFGVELGLQPHLTDFHKKYVTEHPFDFIIGSSHVVHGIDPYYGELFIDRSEDDAYREYFESILENLSVFSDMDVYGHIDYVVRYGPNKNRFYSYAKFKDVIDEILRTLIDKGIGIECNTGGIKYGLGHPNPTEEILSRYHELGGEILTIGSDAHQSVHVAYAFDQVPEMLRACGFRYYTVFRSRKPEFIKLP